MFNNYSIYYTIFKLNEIGFKNKIFLQNVSYHRRNNLVDIETYIIYFQTY